MTESAPMAESSPENPEVARAPISVAGAGNWLVPWDRIGPRVLELLEGRFPGSDVELVDLGSTGLALLDSLRAQELLILVDASSLGGAPGLIRELSPDLAGTSRIDRPEAAPRAVPWCGGTSRIDRPEAAPRAVPWCGGTSQGVLSAHQIGLLETLALAKLLFPETLPREAIAFFVETNGLEEARQEEVCREVAARVCERVERFARRQGKHGPWA
jgi:Ni,Fe-hydrogenase maturation factor